MGRLLLAAGILAGGITVSGAQSLGELARQSRARAQVQPGRIVITSEALPAKAGTARQNSSTKPFKPADRQRPAAGQQAREEYRRLMSRYQEELDRSYSEFQAARASNDRERALCAWQSCQHWAKKIQELREEAARKRLRK